MIGRILEVWIRRLKRGPGRLAPGLMAVALAAGLWAPAPSASAHAALESAAPGPDARLAESPSHVELVFSERIDAKAAVLRVLDAGGRTVADGPAEAAAGGRGVRIPLPGLGDGVYTVTYRIVSADGHPVSGAYVFTVGQPPDRPDAGDFDLHRRVGHDHAHSHGSAAVRTADGLLLYAARWFYYAGLLVAVGLVLWSWQRHAPAAVRETREAGLRLAGQFLLLAAICCVFFQLRELAPGEPASEWWRLLTETTVGRLYLTTLALAVAAPFLAACGPAVRTLWAGAIALAETWNGHAAAVDPPAGALTLGGLHLIAASLWAGGLYVLAGVWRRERQEAGRFALLFSRWALGSFIALWLTGTMMTFLWLPAWGDLLLTPWGSWLLAKAGITVAVAAVAVLIRRRLRRGRLSLAGLLGVDAGLFVALTLCVAVLTHLNPLPARQPLHFHQMGEDLHVTLRITPNAPGDNTFTVKVWLPEDVGGGRPKRVQLRLKAEDRTEGYLEIPLEAYEDPEPDAFAGFVKTTFRAEGPYLPFRGRWTAQIRVTDGEDTEHVRETTFRVI